MDRNEPSGRDEGNVSPLGSLPAVWKQSRPSSFNQSIRTRPDDILLLVVILGRRSHARPLNKQRRLKWAGRRVTQPVAPRESAAATWRSPRPASRGAAPGRRKRRARQLARCRSTIEAGRLRCARAGRCLVGLGLGFGFVSQSGVCIQFAAQFAIQ